MSNPPSYQPQPRVPGSYMPSVSLTRQDEPSNETFRFPPPSGLAAGAPIESLPAAPPPLQYAASNYMHQGAYTVSSAPPTFPPPPPRHPISDVPPTPYSTRNFPPHQVSELHPTHARYAPSNDWSMGSRMPQFSQVHGSVQAQREPLRQSFPSSPFESRSGPQQPPQQLSPGAAFQAPLPPQPRVDIPNGGSHSSGADTKYSLVMRQEPVAARSCGFGERDRRVIDPPPIVELLIESLVLTKAEISARLQYCHYVMSCSIYDETGHHDATFMPEEYRQQRRLMGSLVGAPFFGQDENGKEGCFFCFPDLSCRTPGAFRLKFSLVMIDPTRAREVGHFPTLVETMSDIFIVYNAKDFPGMQASSRLTKRLKEQGCIISIKKGNDRQKNARGALSDGDDDDDNNNDGEGLLSHGKSRRRRIRR